MQSRSVLSEWIETLLHRVERVRQWVFRQVEPQYQETYRIKLRSFSDFEIDDVRERLACELSADEVEVEVTRYFSVRHLGPRELESYYISDSMYSTSPRKNEAEATIKVRIGDDWKTGAEVVHRAGDQLTEFGSVYVIGPDADVYEPLSEPERPL